MPVQQFLRCRSPRWRSGILPGLALAALLAGCHPTRPAAPPPTGAAAPAGEPCRATAAVRCVAVVPAGADAAALEAAALTEKDLTGSGRFVALNQASFPEHPDFGHQALNYPAWAALGVDYLLFEGAGDGTFRFALADVRQQRIVLASDLPMASPAAERHQAHQTADLVLQKLTGVRGIAGTALAYISVSQERGKGAVFRLVVCDADGGNARIVASSREPLMTPAWSPDGRRIAYVGYEHGGSAVFVQDLASGEQRRIVGEHGINGSPAWSPDGNKLAVTLSFGRNPDIYVIDLASGSRQRLTSDRAIETETAWSPDGRSLAFTSDRSGVARVYIMSAEGGTARQLPAIGKQSSNPCFAPDGKSLAMVVEQGGQFRIGLMHLDSNSFELLSAGPRDEKPSFAPNGALLVYAAQDRRLGTLKVRSLDGRMQNELQTDADLREPAWSPYVD